MLENALPRVSDEKLTQLQDTLSQALSSDNSEIAYFVKYALISVDLELQSRQKLVPMQEVSEADKQMVEQEIMNLQENLEYEITDFLSSAISGWINNSRYQEK